MSVPPLPGGLAGPPPGPEINPLDLLAMLPQALLSEDLGLGDYIVPAPAEPEAPPVDIGKIRSWVTLLQGTYSPRDDRFKSDQDLYDMLEAQNASPTTVVRNTPYVVVEKVANMVGALVPVIKVVPPQASLSRTARRVEDLLRQSWEQFDRYWSASLHGSIRRDAAWYGAQRGWIVYRIAYDPYAEPDEIPARLELIEPGNVYPMMDTKGIKFVLHRTYLYPSEVMDFFPEALQLFQDRPPDERLEVVGYYDDTYRAVLVEDRVVVDVTPHNYGFCPWVIRIPGGSPSRGLNQTGNTNQWTADFGPSIYHSARNIYKLQNRVLSQQADIVARASDPPILVHYDKTKGAPEDISLEPGAINYLIAGEDAQVIKSSPSPAELAPLLSAVSEDINKGTIPDVLFGADADQSGLAVATLTGSAKDALFGIVTAMQSAEEEINRKLLLLLRDVHQQPVGVVTKDPSGNWVGGEVLTPEEIGAVGTRVEVQYKDVSLRDRYQMGQLGLAALDKSVLSLKSVRTDYFGVENSEEENNRVIDELIYKDPDVLKNVILPLILYRTDPMMFEMWQTFQQYQQQQKQTPPQLPAGAPPGGPAGAPPGQPLPGTPPTLVPPQQGGQLFDALQQALGAAQGGAGIPRQPGVSGFGGLLPGRQGVR